MALATAGRVSIEEGVVFGTGGGRDLRCDVFTPPEGTSNHAGVLLVHGGGWRIGDRTQLRGYGILLGRIGYTCVASEYRLSDEARWPAQLHDTKAALRWMRANAGRLGIDPEKIAVSGNSAGAHLSLMIAGTQDSPEHEGSGGHEGVGTGVAAAIAFYAPTQLFDRSHREREVRIEGFDAIGALMGDAVHDEAALREASPVSYASSHFPPTLLITGNADELVPAEASFIMYRALRDAGARVELHAYEGAPHGFDALPDFGRQCATIMALFLDRHVVRPRRVVVPAAAPVPRENVPTTE